MINPKNIAIYSTSLVLAISLSGCTINNQPKVPKELLEPVEVTDIKYTVNLENGYKILTNLSYEILNTDPYITAPISYVNGPKETDNRFSWPLGYIPYEVDKNYVIPTRTTYQATENNYYVIDAGYYRNNEGSVNPCSYAGCIALKEEYWQALKAYQDLKKRIMAKDSTITKDLTPASSYILDGDVFFLPKDYLLYSINNTSTNPVYVEETPEGNRYSLNAQDITKYIGLSKEAASLLDKGNYLEEIIKEAYYNYAKYNQNSR